MAQLIAPYNNAMRLGQGFNSYTQQICLDRAVLKDTPQNRKLLDSSSEGASHPLDGNSDLKQSVDGGEPGEVETHADAPGEESTIVTTAHSGRAPSWVKAQIVTYSSKFVDKLSDVTDAMNISGSLSVKTATIGGKANGSYVDSDKFKESDINFHLQVKVTNQIHDGSAEYCLFNKIDKVKKDEFVDVYGDSFISGFEEGGELNAIISIKVTDKSKIFEIKAGLEAELNAKAVGGKITAQGEITKDNISKNTETTVAVNWAGGGSIKDPLDDWTIETIKAAAASFPELVAITPQRTYAILTKYQHLESFQRSKDDFSLIDYENAGIYTSSLLDHFMDYKVMWKQLSNASFELENKRATIEWAQPEEEIYRLADIRSLPEHEVGINLRNSSGKPSQQGQPQQSEQEQQQKTPTPNKLKPIRKQDPWDPPYEAFKPSFGGLILARKVCRIEMAKIVNEVDLVTKNPKYAIDAQRDQYFLHPLIFKQLLPVVRAWSDDNLGGGADVHAPIILGYDSFDKKDKTLPKIIKWDTSVVAPAAPSVLLVKSVNSVRRKAHAYRLQGVAGQGEELDMSVAGAVFNDLVRLDPTFRPQEFHFWSKDKRLTGLRILYTNGEIMHHGLVDDSPTHLLRLDDNGSEGVCEVLVRRADVKKGTYKDGVVTVITSIAVTTTLNQVVDTKMDPPKAQDPTPPAQKEVSADSEVSKTPRDEKAVEPTKYETEGAERETTWLSPDDDPWSCRGFFGVTIGETLVALGTAWGKDPFVPVPSARYTPTMLRASFLGMETQFQRHIKDITGKRPEFAHKFRLSSRLLGTVSSGFEVFSSLKDIDVDYKLKSIAFAATSDHKIAGFQLTYTNGRVSKLASYDAGTFKWSFEVGYGLVKAKFATATDFDDAQKTHIHSAEFIQAEANGQPAMWPYDASASRYLGDVPAGKTISDVKWTGWPMIDEAPTIDGVDWVVQGLYGWHLPGKEVVGIGVVWGHK